jgi:Type II secretion system (T2SS), protein M subtype b
MTAPAYLRGRSGAFLALGVAAAAILLLIVVPLNVMFLMQRHDIEAAKQRIETVQARLQRLPELRRQYSALSANAASTPGLLTANSAVLAQAQLQSEMASIIAANGGTMTSAQILPPEKVRGFDKVAIRYDLTLPLSRLSNLLYAVETHAPYFFIGDAELLMPNQWSSDLAFMPDPVVEVRWVVRAYRWNGRS